jgi:hypothetical protein
MPRRISPGKIERNQLKYNHLNAKLVSIKCHNRPEGRVASLLISAGVLITISIAIHGTMAMLTLPIALLIVARACCLLRS